MTGGRQRRGGGLWAVLAALWCASPLAAEPLSAGKAALDPLAPVGLAQLTVSLLLVLAMIVLAAWLLRRFGRLQSAAGGALRILGGLSLGPRERVVLIQVGKRQLLLGVAPGRVQTLHVLEEPIAVHAEAQGAPPGGFAERLAAALRGKGA